MTWFLSLWDHFIAVFGVDILHDLTKGVAYFGLGSVVTAVCIKCKERLRRRKEKLASFAGHFDWRGRVQPHD